MNTGLFQSLPAFCHPALPLPRHLSPFQVALSTFLPAGPCTEKAPAQESFSAETSEGQAPRLPATYHMITSWMKCNSFFSPLQVVQVLLPRPEHVLHLRGAHTNRQLWDHLSEDPPHPKSFLMQLLWTWVASTCLPPRPASGGSAPASLWRLPLSHPAHNIPGLPPPLL